MKRKPVIEVVDDEMAAVLRRKTPAQSLAVANSMWRYARDSLRERLHRQHPYWDQARLEAETARCLLGSD